MIVWAPFSRTNGFNISYCIYSSSIVFDENLCLATRKDDAQWSSFVAWAVSFTFDAEHYKTPDPSAIPEVNLFGPNFKRMFRDIFQFVGDYEDMWNRNLFFLPRSGRNLAVPRNESTPRHYVPPGFFV